MSFMRRLMTQKIGSTFIPFEDIFLGYGIAITITAPTGCDTANIRMWGGGGGGGDNSGTTAGSGGGGGFTIKKGLSVSGGSSTLTCTAGIGGSGGLNTSGGAGGNTTITGSTTLAANGGSGGLRIGGGGSGGTTTGGDAESEAGTAGGNSGGAGGDAGGQAYGGGQGGSGLTPPTPPGGGGVGTFNDAGETGSRGLIKVRWTKSNIGNTTSYVIYNTPMNFTATTTPSYPTCAIQQIYSTNVRTVWEDEESSIQSMSFVREFIANTSTSTCDFDTINSSFTVRIRANGLTQLPQSFFTSIITPTGATFNSADATYDYDNLGGTPTYDTVWTWFGVSDGIVNSGTNQNVRFKV